MSQADKPQKIENQHMMSLLQRFIPGNHLNQRACEETQSREGEEDIELSLGLSLNGRFGVDPRAKKLIRSSSIPDFIKPTEENGTKKLMRSSSIPDFVKPTEENGTAFLVPLVSNNTALVRTCSLPTETDEEWRKRKEMQMLRRMEAKRKRSEKQKNFKALKDRNRGLVEDNCEEDKRQNGSISHNLSPQQEQFLKNYNGFPGTGSEGLVPKAPSSQGSIGSQGSGSSGTSESESHQVHGMSKCNEARSPVSVQSLSECEQRLTVTSKSRINGKSGSPVTLESRSSELTVRNGAKETVRNIMEDMPCVSTKGDGPNGKRIEGFLYKYRKGEEVRIVCVCHGSFLSPAEFVKHAGGGDVAYPLKHIVVNPYPLL